jgi:hypothetical protein
MPRALSADIEFLREFSLAANLQLQMSELDYGATIAARRKYHCRSTAMTS